MPCVLCLALGTLPLGTQPPRCEKGSSRVERPRAGVSADHSNLTSQPQAGLNARRVSEPSDSSSPQPAGHLRLSNAPEGQCVRQDELPPAKPPPSCKFMSKLSDDCSFKLLCLGGSLHNGRQLKPTNSFPTERS